MLSPSETLDFASRGLVLGGERDAKSRHLLSPNEVADCSPLAISRGEEHSCGRPALVLAFNRLTAQLDAVLLRSAPVSAAVGRGLETRPAWPGGATILVDGLGHEAFEAPFFDVEQLRPPHGQSGEAVIPC